MWEEAIDSNCAGCSRHTPSTALSAAVSAGQSASYALQLTPGLDYNGTVSFTYTGAPLGATCQAPASVVLNTGAPAAFTITVVTSGGALVAPKITSRRSPPTPPLPGAFTLALGALFFILLLRFYRGLSGLIPAFGPQPAPHASRWKVVYAMVALAILVPVLFLTNGCGGAASTPAAQKSSIVTPSGTSTLVITPIATNASGKALQLPLIQLTLVVN
jgi:hypothetical protein